MTSDGALVCQARAGDLSAFEALYNRYKQQVYRTALSLVRSPEVAEEILQDCFLRAHANLKKLDGERGLGPWLHRVTVNLCYTYLKRSKASNESLDDWAEVLPTDSSTLPERSLMRSETTAAIWKGIDALPVSHRAVVILYYLQDFSLEDIAYTLQCPVGTVKSRLFYARQSLKSQLAAFWPERAAAAVAAA